MNYYNPYTGSKKKRGLKRAVLVLASVLIITGGTVIFGNYLKDKAAESEMNSSMGAGRDDSFSETESQIIIPPSKGGTGSSVDVAGECVPLGMAADFSSEGETEDGAFHKRLLEAKERGSGILIPLTGDDGHLLYNSDRAGEVSRLPGDPALPGMAELCDAVAMAKEQGLRVCALMGSGVTLSENTDDADWQIAADSRIAADAAEAGFDEIIISSLVNTKSDITGDTSRVILKYLNQMTSAAGDTAVGLSLPTDVYLDARMSPQIELFISRSVFLTMELTAEQSTLDYVNFVCENLAGTLSVYNMRLIVSPADTDMGTMIEEKLRAVEHENYLYATVPETPVEEPAVDETGTETEAETEK